MSKMHVKKSILIHAPTDKVYKIISDFNHWSSWSPWLIMEPEAKVDVATDAKFYSWEGTRVGAGNMKITAENPNKSVDMDLTFLKPWKSVAKVRFELQAKGNETEVLWLMDSSLPFFMFWMKKMMVAWIGMDFERGLAMLKDYTEDGKVHSRLHFKGTSQFGGCNYIGIRRDCTINTVGPCMKEDFDKIWQYIGKNKDLVNGYPFSIYHKWDMVKGNVSYTAGVPVNTIPADLSSGMVSGAIPATEIYTLEHVGNYRHLGNAWSTLNSMQRNKEFNSRKGFHPFEVYVNNPNEVPEEELITAVNFAVK